MNISKKILDNMPKNLSDLEKARYIYIELGKILTFSTKFQNTDDDSFFEMLNKKVDVTNALEDELKINCVMWSQYYSQLLTLVNIKNEIINMSHQYVEFDINNEKWIADATYGLYSDLSRIANHDDTAYFGPALFQSKNSNTIYMSEETEKLLSDIDQKLGYNTKDKQNLMEFKELLYQIKEGNIDIEDFSHNNEINKSNRTCFKLEFLFSKLGKIESGYYEFKDFVYHLEKLILTEQEQKNVGSVELKRTNKDKTVDIIECIYALNEDEYNYYLLGPNTSIKKVDSSQIIKLSVMGYGIENKKIPGIIYPRKFVPGKVNFDIKYSLLSKFLNSKLIDFDNIECINESQSSYK